MLETGFRIVLRQQSDGPRLTGNKKSSVLLFSQQQGIQT